MPLKGTSLMSLFMEDDTEAAYINAPQKGLRFLVIGRLQNLCFFVLFCCGFFGPTSEICNTCICGYGLIFTKIISQQPDRISHTQSMVAKRGRTNRANIHTPYVKKSFKTQNGRNPVDPAILAAIRHRFIAKREEN